MEKNQVIKTLKTRINKFNQHPFYPRILHLKLLDLLLGPGKDPKDFTNGGKVPAADVVLCMNEFRDLVYKTPATEVPIRLRAAFSSSIAFSGQSLQDWIIEMVKKGKTVVNNIRIFIGIYSTEYIRRHSGELSPGLEYRLSVFLWPYLDDNPSVEGAGSDPRIDPFNLGGLEP
jgi:hypothetical protein